MLRFFRNSRKTVLFILVLGAATIGMTAFGVRSYGGSTGRDRPLIKVGEKEFSRDDLFSEKTFFERNIRAQLSDKFKGPFLEKFIEEQLKESNNPQRVVDRLVDKAALEGFLDNLSFVTGKSELSRAIKELFGNQPISSTQFAVHANSLGMSSQGLENKIETDLRENSFRDILLHVSQPSKGELEAEVRKQETTYGVLTTSFLINDFLKEIKDPDAATIESYYQEQASTYEFPARIKYSWAELPSDQMKDLVEVRPDDIEVYFATNEKEFLTPEGVRADIIRLKVPAGTLPDDIEKIRERGDEALKKISEGKPFTDVMVDYSDDKSQKTTADGYLTRADFPKEVAEKVFALKSGGMTDVIRTVDAFYIVNVNEFRPSQPKPLESVKDEVIAKIKEEQGPIFAASYLETLTKELGAGNGDFKGFATQKKLAFGGETTLLGAKVDPDKAPKGLTEKLLENPVVGPQAVEVGGRFIIAQVTEAREREIPGLSEVKDVVISEWKRNQAKQKAFAAATDFSKNVTAQGFKEAAQKQKLKVESIDAVSAKKPPLPQLFQNEASREALFAQTKPFGSVFGPVDLNNAYVVWTVDKVTLPSADDIAKKVKEVEGSKQAQTVNVLLQGIIEQMKSKQEVNIDPSALIAS